MTDIKPCTVKKCRETKDHHHRLRDGSAFACDRKDECVGGGWNYGPPVAPRPTRKALNARIAELEAENAGLIDLERGARLHIAALVEENADLHAEIADKKDRLARLEKATIAAPVVRQYAGPGSLDIYADDHFIGRIFIGTTQFIAVSESAKSAKWFDIKDDAAAHLVAAAREAGVL